MKYVQINLGFMTADAEDVRLEFDGSNLVLTCRDIEEKPVRHTFRDVLAYRWGQDLDAEGIRDDVIYEVQDSPWLRREAQLVAVDPNGWIHLKLGFNACGVLDVLAKREETLHYVD